MLGRPQSAECSLTSGDVLRVPIRVREHYLTPEAGEGECIVQASGETLHVWFWSENANLRLDISLAEFCVGPPLRRSLNRWGVNLSRWSDELPESSEGSVSVSLAEFDGGEMPDV